MQKFNQFKILAAHAEISKVRLICTLHIFIDLLRKIKSAHNFIGENLQCMRKNLFHQTL